MKTKYLEKYGYKCMHPECKSGFNIEVHHIVPLSVGGIDNEDNYIALCSKCHGRVRKGSRNGSLEIELAVYKYYAEGQDETRNNALLSNGF